MTRIIKHRCNTVESVEQALADGYDGVEVDVQFEFDGSPVLCHDASPVPRSRPALWALRDSLRLHPDRDFFIEVKPCNWHVSYLGAVYAALDDFKNNVVVISFEANITHLFEVYGFHTAPILGRGQPVSKGLNVCKRDEMPRGATCAVYGPNPPAIGQVPFIIR